MTPQRKTAICLCITVMFSTSIRYRSCLCCFCTRALNRLYWDLIITCGNTFSQNHSHPADSTNNGTEHAHKLAVENKKKHQTTTKSSLCLVQQGSVVQGRRCSRDQALHYSGDGSGLKCLVDLCWFMSIFIEIVIHVWPCLHVGKAILDWMWL